MSAARPPDEHTTRRLLILLAALLPIVAAAQPPAPGAQRPPWERPAAPAADAGDAAAQPTLADDKDAIDAGRKWLALIDAGKPGTAWDSASKQLQTTVQRGTFVAEMRSVRAPLGKPASRDAVKFARAHELPGAPSGDYTIIEFETRFAGGKRLTEQLVWVVESGDVWRVAGYYYR